MPDTLATELLELIVGFVASDPTQERIADLLSLCLSCKALVPCSQRHIFSNVVLYPPVNDRSPKQWVPTSKTSRRYDRTASFLQTVSQRPHLASHVRALTCNFTAQWLNTDPTHLPNALQVLECMENLKSLTIAFVEPYGSGCRLSIDEPSVSLSEWMTGIVSVLQTRRLEALTLKNLSDYPGETILRSTHLRHLTLCNTKLQPVISSKVHESATSDVPHLQSLECDWVSLKDGLMYLLSELDVTVDPPSVVDAGHGALVSQIQVLDVSSTLTNQVEIASLLSQTACLRSLILRVQATDRYPTACPLDSLNLASFDTLTQLTLHICVGITGSGMDLVFPYGFAWKDALSQMQKLEKFELHLEYEGNFDVSQTSFGVQWRDVPELLADSNRMPQLKDVSISVKAKVPRVEGVDEKWPSFEEEDEDEPRSIREDAWDFLRSVKTIVYPRWFLPLSIRQQQGGLDVFCYSTELSEARRSGSYR